MYHFLKIKTKSQSVEKESKSKFPYGFTVHSLEDFLLSTNKSGFKSGFKSGVQLSHVWGLLNMEYVTLSLEM